MKSSRNNLRNRSLRIESLENRELLSVNVAEFEAIQKTYAELGIAESIEQYNVIELSAEKLTAAELQNAVDAAAKTEQDDLIVVRTTKENNTLKLEGKPIEVNIDAEKFGSVVIVAFAGADSVIPLNINQIKDSALSIVQGNVSLAGMTFFGDEAQYLEHTTLPTILSVGENAHLTTSNVGFFWQGETLTYTVNYTDRPSETFLNSEKANLGFWTPYAWTDSVVLSAQESFFLGDNVFGTDQNVLLSFAVSNLGNENIDQYSAEIWIDGKLSTTLDSLSLDAWQLGGMANITLGSFAVGEHKVEVVLNDSNQSNVSYATSFVITDETPHLDMLQDLYQRWDADFGGYFLYWTAVEGASRYVLDFSAYQEMDAHREYCIGTSFFIGSQSALTTGYTIQIAAENGQVRSQPLVTTPPDYVSYNPIKPMTSFAGSWPDLIDPYNITRDLKTSGNAQRMNQTGYSLAYPIRTYSSVSDAVYVDLFQDACERWEEIITSGLSEDDRFIYLGAIDDLRIEFGFSSFGNQSEHSIVLTGAKRTTTQGGLPVTCTFAFNKDVFTANPNQALQDRFYDAVLQDIGRALGYDIVKLTMPGGYQGLLLDKGLLTEATVKPFNAMTTFTNPNLSGYNTHYYYTGTNGVREFQNVFGTDMPFTGNDDRFLMETSQTLRRYISEVYATYFSGFANLQQTEVMSKEFAADQRLCISRITLGVLEDLGYTVDYAMADPFGSYSPINLEVRFNDHKQVSLAWDAVHLITGATYEVWRKNVSDLNSSWELIGTTTSKTFDDTTFASYTKYEYQVVASNVGSAVYDVGIFSVPPSGQLTWSDAPAATSYAIYRLEVDPSSNELSWNRIATVSDKFYNVGMAVNYTTYYHVTAFSVAPFDTEHQPSRAVRIETQLHVPNGPTGLTATPQASRNVNLSWNAVSGVTSYEVYWLRANGTEQLLTTTTSTAYTTARVTFGSNTFRVYAVASDAKSEAASTTTMVRPAAPTGLTATPQTSRNVNLSWNAVSGATSYEVYWLNTSGVQQLLTTTTSGTCTTPRVPYGSNTFYVYALAGGGAKSVAASVTTTV